MEANSKDLIKDLSDITVKIIKDAERFGHMPYKTLNWKPDQESWSILECLAHLNLYGDYYIPEIGRQIKRSKFSSTTLFKSGWLGNYFANSMLPKQNLNKMKTFRSMNPSGSQLQMDTIDKFIDQQHKYLELLDRSKTVDLNKTKTNISISKLIKLRLGDTLRVVIYHNQRHMIQAEKVLTQFGNYEKA